jgi:Mg-chelatase subunit ChlD
MNYIFVIDVSGSMAGEKLNIVKTSIEELFSQMRADDVIGVIAFNHQAKTLLKATPKKNISPA